MMHNKCQEVNTFGISLNSQLIHFPYKFDVARSKLTFSIKICPLRSRVHTTKNQWNYGFGCIITFELPVRND